jgi:hypothetical protein
LKEFLREAYVLPLALCAPLVATLLFTRSVLPVHNYLQLATELTAGGVVYGSGMLWWFLAREPMGIESRTRVKLYVLQVFSR